MRPINGLMLILCVLAGHLLWAGTEQPKGVNGRIFNAETQQPLPATNIAILGTDYGTSSDGNGFFRIDVPSDSAHLHISHIGFSETTIPLYKSSGFDNPLIVYLVPASIEMQTIEIDANQFQYVDRSIEALNIKKIRARDVVSLPGAMDDPIRAAQIYSGTSSSGDFSSFLTTRGSSPAQNKVIMDGIAIPNPYRMRIAMGGGLSIFNPQTVDDVHLHLGGYSAQFGNALSSILEVSTRQGSREKNRFSVSFNLTDLNGVAEGPLFNRRGSYLVSVRRTYFDLLASGYANQGSVLPFSQEILSKMTVDLTPTLQLEGMVLHSTEEMNLLSGGDNPADFNSTETAGLTFSNFSLRAILMKSMLLHTRLAFYHDKTQFKTWRATDTDDAFDVQEIYAKTNQLNFQQSLFWQFDSTYALHVGSSWIRDFTDADFQLRAGWMHNARTEYPVFAQFENQSWMNENYTELTARYATKTQIRAGVRYDFSQVLDEGHWGVRLNAIQDFSNYFRLKASWGTIYQYPNYTTIYTHEFPLNLGGNIDSLNAEKATQNVFGIESNYFSGFRLQFDVYHTRIDDMFMPVHLSSEQPINAGVSIANGFEIIAEKNMGERFTGLFSFSHGQSKYKREGEPEWTISKYSLETGLTLLLNYKIKKGWSSSLLWRHASGLPYTNFRGTALRHHDSERDILDGRYMFSFITDERNNAQFPAYQRLDGRISYRRKSSGRNLHFYVDFINLLNHKNLYEIIWSISNGTGSDREKLTANKHKLYMLPFLPSIGFSISL